MFTEEPKILKKKKLTVVKKFAKSFQTWKKQKIFLLIFKKLQEKIHFFLKSCKKYSIFFEKCEKCINFSEKRREVFEFRSTKLSASSEP